RADPGRPASLAAGRRPRPPKARPGRRGCASARLEAWGCGPASVPPAGPLGDRGTLSTMHRGIAPRPVLTGPASPAPPWQPRALWWGRTRRRSEAMRKEGQLVFSWLLSPPMTALVTVFVTARERRPPAPWQSTLFACGFHQPAQQFDQ